MDISRRGILKAAPAVALGAASGLLVEGFSCTTTQADDFTLVLTAAAGLADIAAGIVAPALVPLINAAETALQQVATEWGSTDTTAQKWEKMLAILLALPATLLHPTATEATIITALGAAINVVITTIQALMGGAASVSARVAGQSIGAPRAEGVANLLKLIKSTQAKLAKT